MRAFGQPLKAPQQNPSAAATVRGRAHLGPERDARSLLGLQGTIGNQAVQRILQRKPEETGPANKPVDPVVESLLEAEPEPREPRGPEAVVPGDPKQQAEAIPTVHPDSDLWPLPHIQERLLAIATEMEARRKATAKPGQAVDFTAAKQVARWEQSFFDSVNYILYRRDGGQQAPLRRKLRAAEEQLLQSFRPPRHTPEMFREMGRAAMVTAQVEELRRTYSEKWKQIVENTADRFVTLASHQARFLTVPQAASPVAIYGLPDFEGTVEAEENKSTMAKDSTPVAPSVIKFWQKVQKESGFTNAKVGNYANHEKHSPYLGNIDNIGKYSFDVHLTNLKVNAEGFYEREPLIQFFLAVDRAAAATDTAWIALYNDFEVAKAVNEKLKKRRIGFSGMGSTKDDPGSIHHGPAPYLLHIHFNVMPTSLAGQYLANKGKNLPYIDLGRTE